MKNLQQKYQKLKEIIKESGSAAIAVSGGVDSLFLLRTAHAVLGNKVVALHMSTPYTFKSEFGSVWLECNLAGIQIVKIQSEIPNDIIDNPENRCYLCKTALFTKMIVKAQKMGYKNLMDGTNADDNNAHRPGRKALEELFVISPLKKANLSKAEIRVLAKEMGYSFHNQPSNSCLLTRLPYNYKIQARELHSIEDAETYLINKGFSDVRVRSNNFRTCIEVNPQQINQLKDVVKQEETISVFMSSGLVQTKVDEVGYIAGRKI